MGQQIALTAYDAAATPLAHVFQPEFNDVDSGQFVAKWRELSTTLPVSAQARVTMQENQLKSGVIVRKLRVEVPVLESATTAGVEGYTAPPKVALTPAMEVTYFAHPRDVTANQRTVRQMVVNLLGGVATSVTPVTSGQVVEFFDLGLKPY